MRPAVMVPFSAAPDLAGPGIYLHIPYCRSKCHYCAFNSRAGREGEIPAYLAALRRHLGQMAEHSCWQRLCYTSLYIGGGTPTLCPADALARLITRCRTLFSFVPEPEITVEANPDTLAGDMLHLLRQAGVTRLSIGVQSLIPDELHRLGRRHTVADASRAFSLARQVGFASVSLDLMFGLPGQTVQSWQQTLRAALELAPDHFSLYELMVEEGTECAAQLQRRAMTLPTDDEVAAMAGITNELLAAAGFHRYEISNYARVGHRCRHNCNYWENGSWLALGAGAVGSLAGMKISCVVDPSLYIRRIAADASPYREIESLCRPALFRETVVMGLRMTDGISLARLRQRFGLDPLDYYGASIRRLLADRVLVLADDRLRLTAAALPVANQVLARLV
ncbi:MAG: radical SAM family heme chaperone HemW [Thermodesulfobacteriota bacterium]